jgi:hypothetical protein
MGRLGLPGASHRPAGPALFDSYPGRYSSTAVCLARSGYRLPTMTLKPGLRSSSPHGTPPAFGKPQRPTVRAPAFQRSSRSGQLDCFPRRSDAARTFGGCSQLAGRVTVASMAEGIVQPSLVCVECGEIARGASTATGLARRNRTRFVPRDARPHGLARAGRSLTVGHPRADPASPRGLAR